ncbi:MAG: bifunctional folylpolyglutamate synthase/dihydrofolate synthase [Lachnospiraceae bacterium]|nr:bifunctional folylpolyglutamate synthase/dihydrofolate synthase [Lachnospiraceae bacterium]
MTEKQRIEYTQKLAIRGSVLGLDSMRKLMQRLGNPERNLSVIQIAGTNGKGSILAMLSAILKAAGYKVGTYSSPAVFEEREIIRINGKNISSKDYLLYHERMQEVTDAMEAAGEVVPTLFEVQTAMAFWYFQEKKVDYVILETGMGGRDDATNICEKNLAAVFATISLDHMAILGRTISEIASVKAGIMRKGCPVILGMQSAEGEAVLRSKAAQMECPLYENKPYSAKCYKTKTQFSYEQYRNLEVALLGRHQAGNAVTVLETVRALQDQGISITEKAIRQGLSEVFWPGRMEIISEKPLIILDGAHNEDAALRLKDALIELTGEKPLVFIMGMFKDKDCERVAEIMAPLAAQIITITTNNPSRAMASHDLAELVRKYNLNVTEAGSIEEAVEIAELLSGRICPIIAFGSLSYLGDIRKCFLAKRGNK